MKTVNILFSTQHLFHPLSSEYASENVKTWDHVIAGVFLVLSSIFTAGVSAIFYATMAYRKVKQIEKESSSTATKSAEIGQKVLVTGSSNEREKIITDLTKGTISFNEFVSNDIPFIEKLKAMLTYTTAGERHIIITDVPTRSGTGTMHLTINIQRQSSWRVADNYLAGDLASIL